VGLESQEIHVGLEVPEVRADLELDCPGVLAWAQGQVGLAGLQDLEARAGPQVPEVRVDREAGSVQVRVLE